MDNAADTVGLLRTADGALRLMWLSTRASNSTYLYGTPTISLAGRLLATGTAVSNWTTLESDPQLVSDGSGLALVFEGNTGTSGCIIDGAVFTATSADGSAWALVNGSMSAHAVGVGSLAATAESDETTHVAGFAGGHLFHVGVDSNCPASSPDGTITPTPGSGQSNPAMATDPSNGCGLDGLVPVIQ